MLPNFQKVRMAFEFKRASILGDGAQGRNRTTDTAIFSRMLYQLSYLGMLAGPKRPKRAGGL